MKYCMLITLPVVLMFISGCQSTPPVCPPLTGTPQYLTTPPGGLATPEPEESLTQVEINGKMMQVDKVVEGPLCNDTWSGTVYVTCDVQVYEWVEHPLFLKDCALDIELGTVVYVADHNDTAYYNGCSCHVTGEELNP